MSAQNNFEDFVASSCNTSEEKRIKKADNVDTDV